MKDIFLKKSIPQIIQEVKLKKLNLDEILKESLNKYEKYNNKINSWKFFEKRKIKKKFSDSQNKYDLKTNSDLEGIPFGIKDIFNTIDFKTEMGSKIWKNFTPGNNARVVDCLEGSGAIAMGKNETAEFAVHRLGKTKNPHNKFKTPGTSSSGSASAVCTGDVPFSLASQTAASIIRPASYCGVWGMKPSFGLIPRVGVLKTNDTLDTIGFITSNLFNLDIVLENTRLRGLNHPYIYKNIDKNKIKQKNKIKIGFLETDLCLYTKDYIKDSVENFLSKISKNKKFSIEKIIWPEHLNRIDNVHQTIYDKSLAYYFNKEYEKKNLSRIMKEIIKRGKEVKNRKFVEAIHNQENIIKKVDKLLEGYDIVFTYSASSSAINRNETELSDSSLIWTMAHIPSINIPFEKCPNQMPYGIQAIARKWSDFNLIKSLEKIEAEGLISSTNLKLNP